MAYKPSFTVTFDENVDYAQMKEDAIAAGDYRRAAMAELSRNLKIEQTGSQYPQTHDFGSALDIDMMTDEELKEAYEARQAAGRTRDWAAANELVENILNAL